jgi:hypothetical protein
MSGRYSPWLTRVGGKVRERKVEGPKEAEAHQMACSYSLEVAPIRVEQMDLAHKSACALGLDQGWRESNFDEVSSFFTHRARFHRCTRRKYGMSVL